MSQQSKGALSSLGIVVNRCRTGNYPLINKSKRGILRPLNPRYTETWDIKPVLKKRRNMDSLHSLSLKELTLKLVMLMVLTQAARVQTFHLLVLKNISIGEDYIPVWLRGNIKQCRPKFDVQFVKNFGYAKDDEILCVYETLKYYFVKTKKKGSWTR